MALLETKTAEQARRLELDGFNRVGETAVETEFANLKKLLDRDDTKTKKIVIARKNGGREEELVNDFIKRELEGKYKQIRRWKSGTWGKSKPSPQTRVVFSADEHQIRIKYCFEQILEGKLPEREEIDDYWLEKQKNHSPKEAGYSTATFEAAKRKHIDYLDGKLDEAEEKEEIEKLRQKLEEAKELEKSDRAKELGG